MNYSHRLLRSSIARVSTTFANVVVTFFLMPFVVRTLGDYWYGLWVAVSGIALYYYLLDFGLSSAVSRFVSSAVARNDTERVNQVVNTAGALFAGLGLLVLLVTGGLWLGVPRFVAAEYVWPVRMVVLLQGVTMGLGFPSKALGGVAAAQLRYDLVEVLNVALLLGNAGLTVLVLTHGGGIVGLAWVMFVLGMANSVAYYVLVKRLWPALALRAHYIQADTAKELFGYSIWSFLNNLSNMVRFRIDALVVAGFCGASVVTHYGIGASLAEYGLNLINRATNILTPVFARYQAEGDHAAIRSKLLFFTKLNAVLSIFGFGLLFVLGQPFIVRWMGARYADAYLVLLVMGAALMIEALMQPANNAVYGLARHRPYAIAALCEAAANAALSILLVRKYGMIGVAVGTAIPLAINKLLFTPLYTCRVVGLAPWRFYAPILRTAALTAAFLLLVHLGYLRWGGGATYSGILAVLCTAVPAYLPVALYGILTREERSVLRRLVPLAAGSSESRRLRGRTPMTSGRARSACLLLLRTPVTDADWRPQPRQGR